MSDDKPTDELKKTGREHHQTMKFDTITKDGKPREITDFGKSIIQEYETPQLQRHPLTFGMARSSNQEKFEVVNKQDGLLVKYNFGETGSIKYFNGQGLEQLLKNNTHNGQSKTPRVKMIESAIQALKDAKTGVETGTLQLSNFPWFDDPTAPDVAQDKVTLSTVIDQSPGGVN